MPLPPGIATRHQHALIQLPGVFPAAAELQKVYDADGVLIGFKVDTRDELPTSDRYQHALIELPPDVGAQPFKLPTDLLLHNGTFSGAEQQPPTTLDEIRANVAKLRAALPPPWLDDAGRFTRWLSEIVIGRELTGLAESLEREQRAPRGELRYTNGGDAIGCICCGEVVPLLCVGPVMVCERCDRQRRSIAEGD